MHINLVRSVSTEKSQTSVLVFTLQKKKKKVGWIETWLYGLKQDSTRGSSSRHARENLVKSEKKRPQMSRLSPFVLNDFVLSLKCPFCFVLCPFRPSNTRLKFAETVLFYFSFCWDLELLTWLNACAVIAECPIPNCGTKYLVKLSNHLTGVHALDYINRRKWLQEAKLQPKVRVMIYPAKRSQGLRRRSSSEALLLVHEKEKDTVVHQLSTPKIWNLYQEVLEKKPIPSNIVILSFSLLSELACCSNQKCFVAAVTMTTLFNGVMEISKIAKTGKTLNLARKRTLPKKWQST